MLWKLPDLLKKACLRAQVPCRCFGSAFAISHARWPPDFGLLYARVERAAVMLKLIQNFAVGIRLRPLAQLSQESWAKESVENRCPVIPRCFPNLEKGTFRSGDHKE